MSELAEKHCPKCDKTKPICEFWRDPSKATGYRSHCRECLRAVQVERSRRWRARNRRYDIDYGREYRRKNAAKLNAYFANYRRKHPEKVAAHAAVHAAVLAGELTPQACVACGATTRVHAHHEDYSKSLSVMWLCGACHRRHHAGTIAIPEAPVTT